MKWSLKKRLFEKCIFNLWFSVRNTNGETGLVMLQKSQSAVLFNGYNMVMFYLAGQDSCFHFSNFCLYRLVWHCTCCKFPRTNKDEDEVDYKKTYRMGLNRMSSLNKAVSDTKNLSFRKKMMFHKKLTHWTLGMILVTPFYHTRCCGVMMAFFSFCVHKSEMMQRRVLDYI